MKMNPLLRFTLVAAAVVGSLSAVTC
ncbi:MAG: hypothetical protein QOE73_276, partial [Verrucomicrobiota bacterium]